MYEIVVFQISNPSKEAGRYGPYTLEEAECVAELLPCDSEIRKIKEDK